MLAREYKDMTIRYPLKPLEREALWEAHNRLCYYCRHSLVLRSMEVDHLISQDLAENSGLWAKTLEEFGLPKDFDVDGLNNLVPACRLCNADKSNRVFSPGRIVIDLNVIAKRRIEVEDRFDNAPSASRSKHATPTHSRRSRKK